MPSSPPKQPPEGEGTPPHTPYGHEGSIVCHESCICQIDGEASAMASCMLLGVQGSITASIRISLLMSGVTSSMSAYDGAPGAACVSTFTGTSSNLPVDHGCARICSR